MKFWTTGFVLALGAMLPALSHAQEPWVMPGPGYAAPGNLMMPAGMPPSGMMPSGYCPPPAGSGLYDELIPQGSICYDTDSRRDLNFKEAFSNSYVRLDYLSWQITGGRHKLLGAPNSSGADLSGQDTSRLLVASDTNGPRAPAPTWAKVPSLPDNQNMQNGLRGVFGIPTRVGTLESEVFYFEQMDSNVNAGPGVIPGTLQPIIAATTLLRDGLISPNTMILYSEDYQAREKATFFGAESNWIFPALTPNVRTTAEPLVGFRYINFADRLTIQGTDLPDPSDPTTEMNHYIGAITRNNIFGPQFGMRFKTVVGRFDLGCEPKFIVGINRLSEGVSTRQIYSPTEADRADRDTRTEFAPVFDLSASAKLHVSDRFALYVAYDLMVAGGFSRTYNAIDYNSSSTLSDPPQISLRRDLSSFLAQGFAVGGELTFR